MLLEVRIVVLFGGVVTGMGRGLPGDALILDLGIGNVFTLGEFSEL